MVALSSTTWRCALVLLLGIFIGIKIIIYRYGEEAVTHFGIRGGHGNGEDTTHRFDVALLPGHMGVPVSLDPLDSEITALVHDETKRYGFNGYASAIIPVKRVLPDLRHPECIERNRHKQIRLPKTSVVIVFFNEPWSVLLRTVHSVLNNSPEELIHEILLVDDGSYLPFLKTGLEEYFRPYGQVRILRAPERLGLIRARIYGSKNTTSSVLTFLDAHVECTTGWLKPLLEQVMLDDTTIAVPLIDRIDDKDMHLITNLSSALLGAFAWDLNFGWWYRSTFPTRSQTASEPFPAPAMAGGLFTITRRFFERLGWYDQQFRVYGMENTELSIKCWMCGGQIMTVPCSHVAHIRKSAHPFIDDRHQNVTFLNSVRLAEVWMDKYRQIVFDVNGIPGYSVALFGSVTNRKAFRRGAACKSFHYYLQRAYPEMPSPIVPGQFRGEVRSVAMGNRTCLTADETSRSIHMAPCDKRNQTQYWTHNFYRELNSYKRCIDAGSSDTTPIRLATCHRMHGAQSWSYDVHRLQLKSLAQQRCLGVNTAPNDGSVMLKPCDDHDQTQQWYVMLYEYDFWKPFQ